jgi:hypothetical protein
MLAVNLALLSTSLFIFAGCGKTPTASNGTTTPSKPPNPPSVAQHVVQPSVYVEDDSTFPSQILIFPQTATDQTTSTLRLTGSYPSVDASGNLYVVQYSGGAIVEFSGASLNNVLRSLPVGPGTKISKVVDMVASEGGDIYVNDGTGIAVFDSSANANADPARYIVGKDGISSAKIIPGSMAVDKSGTLYVVDTAKNSIVVFGPTDSGYVVPKRTISTLSAYYIGGLTTDSDGNLYLTAITNRPASAPDLYAVGIFEFNANADGNAAPIRTIFDPNTREMYPYFFSMGIAVNSFGTIYVSAGKVDSTTTVPAVFEFAPGSSGNNVVPSGIVTIDGWMDSETPRIAVH